MKVHFSSKTDLHETPQKFFNELNEEFNFTLDVCATVENAKCDRFYTIQDDGLVKDWCGVVWMNPPYGRAIGKWMAKAYNEANKKNLTIVCLVPSRTDTKWWHSYVIEHQVRFIKGRLKFGNAKNSAPFPSAVVIMNRLPNYRDDTNEK
jgi:phage N-6-adenine-methyltransferase